LEHSPYENDMESRGEKCSWDGVRFWPIEASNTLEIITGK